MPFQPINPRELSKSVFELISDNWALLSAGDESGYNTMTVSWGALGELWGKDAAFAFVRPQRYTHEFLERSACFTLSFFDKAQQDILRFCGAKSGRDVDKAQQTGLVPVFQDGSVFFEQAREVLVCRKIAVQQLDPAGFLDESIAGNYPGADYHSVFIGEITKAYLKK